MKIAYIKLITIIIALTGLASCTDWLTVQPEGKVTSDTYWKNESSVNQVVMSCYKALIETSCLKNMIVWGEFRSDNLGLVTLRASDDLKNIYAANILPKNPYTKWGDFYKAINYCNFVLYNAPKVVDPNYSTRKLHAHMAEALTIRALSYFYLVRAFKNVPLVLEPSVSDLQDYRVKQSTEDEVLDQIESDLLQAEQWALTNYTTVTESRGRVTVDAVRALLADVYLWRGKYSDCITYCNKIIASPNHQLIKDIDLPYLRIFGLGNSLESIFELQFDIINKNQAITDFYGNYSATSPYNSNAFCAASFLASTSSNEVFLTSENLPVPNDSKTADNRRADFISEKPDQNIYYITKYVKYYRGQVAGSSSYIPRNSSQTPNWILYRLSDVMLMKAEAMAELSRSQDASTETLLRGALHLVNTTYMRSNPTIKDTLEYLPYATPKAMEELVLLERQRELMFEGKRWFDLLRKARRDGNTKWLVDQVIRKYANDPTISTSIIRAKMTDMNSLYWPINESELNINHNLVQNPYYDSNTLAN